MLTVSKLHHDLATVIRPSSLIVPTAFDEHGRPTDGLMALVLVAVETPEGTRTVPVDGYSVVKGRQPGPDGRPVSASLVMHCTLPTPAPVGTGAVEEELVELTPVVPFDGTWPNPVRDPAITLRGSKKKAEGHNEEGNNDG